jgi:hypothetical protein
MLNGCFLSINTHIFVGVFGSLLDELTDDDDDDDVALLFLFLWKITIK